MSCGRDDCNCIDNESVKKKEKAFKVLGEVGCVWSESYCLYCGKELLFDNTNGLYWCLNTRCKLMTVTSGGDEVLADIESKEDWRV